MSKIESAVVIDEIVAINRNSNSATRTMTDKIPPTMTALLLTAHNTPYKLTHDHPTPRIESPTHVIIKIAVAGFCHSDDMIRCPPKLSPHDIKRAGDMPFVASHEAVGYVCEIGENVRGIKAGDRVGALAFRDPCGECYDCQLSEKGILPGARVYCNGKTFLGINTDGAAAEYMLADSRFVVPLPDALPFEMAAPLMCAGTTIYRAIKISGAQPGQTIAFVGIGALGHLGIQFAKSMGMRVVAVDARDAPLEMAKTLKYPPDIALDSRNGVKTALDAIGGGGVDVCLVCTHVDEAFTYGLNITRPHGVFVTVGIPADIVPVHINHLVFRDITVKGTFMSDTVSAKEMVDLVVDKEIEVKTHVYGLHESDKLLEDYASGNLSGKLVFRVSE